MVKVIKPGLNSTIQDLGRFGYQDYGVPVSGSMDQYSAKLKKNADDIMTRIGNRCKNRQ